MVPRILQTKVIKSLGDFPVVGILGSRQVGKTTLAMEIKRKIGKKAVYLDLELPSDLNKLQEAELYLSRHLDSLVIIDEIQHMPALFPLLRALVDKRRKSGRYLILGSASPDLVKKSSESLAGRIKYYELTPFSIREVVTNTDILSSLWLKGGYPDSFLADSDDQSMEWRQAFIKTYLERDIPKLGIRVPSPQLKRFWMMIAHSHGQLWNASQISRSLGVSSPTVRHYLDILQETFILRQLQPFHINIRKRLIKSPKVYLRDSGLLHALMSLSSMDDLTSHPVISNSWEGFVIEQIFRLLPEGWDCYFYRTLAGAEIDLVLVRPRRKPIAVEIKYSASPKVTTGFWNAFNDLKCSRGFVVYPGAEGYPIARNVLAIPVTEIAHKLEFD